MSGVIPPIFPGSDPTGARRSPYTVGIEDFILNFATSADRVRILNGLLRLRADLYQIGIIAGYQWLDGSFLEDVEGNQNRSPNDIDVVSFLELPPGHDQAAVLPQLLPLLQTAQVKANYQVDHYALVLATATVDEVCYWYSLWSHRRDGTWKGFAKVNFDPASDQRALIYLATNPNGVCGL